METWSPQSSAYGVPQKPEGDGWQLTGYNNVRINNPKMGSGFTTKQVPIYMRQAQQAAPVQTAPAAPKLTIKDLYQTVLGRDPDAEGAAYWQTAFGPDIDAAEAAAFGLAAAGEKNPPPAATTPTSVSSPIPTPTYQPPPQQTGPDFAALFSQMQAQSQAQLEQVMGPLIQTIGQIQRQIVDESSARQEDYRRAEEARQAGLINQARSQAAGNLQIQGAPGNTADGGTSAFKIRKPALGAIDQNIPELFPTTLNL